MLARDTKVYKDTVTLLNEVIGLVSLFSKITKYTIGEYAIKSCVEILTCVQMINITKDPAERLSWFDEFIVQEERLRTLMEVGLSSSTRQKNVKRDAEYTRLIVEVGKQMTAWKAATEKQIADKFNAMQQTSLQQI